MKDLVNILYKNYKYILVNFAALVQIKAFINIGIRIKIILVKNPDPKMEINVFGKSALSPIFNMN